MSICLNVDPLTLGHLEEIKKRAKCKRRLTGAVLRRAVAQLAASLALMNETQLTQEGRAIRARRTLRHTDGRPVKDDYGQGVG